MKKEVKNRYIPMTERLWRNKARLLLRKVLEICAHSEKMEPMPQCKRLNDGSIGKMEYIFPDSDYCLQSDAGKLFQEIHNFLNKKSVLNSQDD